MLALLFSAEDCNAIYFVNMQNNKALFLKLAPQW